jgi:ribonuclease HII
MARQFDRAEIPPSPDLAFERELWDGGLQRVAGVDEAGRGAWAGPVTAGAVILPPDACMQDLLWGVRDSKQMRPEARTVWAEEIRLRALTCAVGFASSAEIDALGIIPATRLAMRRALEGLTTPPQHILIDALRLAEIPLPQTALIKGDARSLSIAAASVLAKTARDAWMINLETQYPGYAFARHKGYGTQVHQAALLRLGPAPIHRRCFAPVNACIHPPDADKKTEAA